MDNDSYQSENLTNGRKFGHRMRRLTKIVSRAFHNPSELNNIQSFNLVLRNPSVYIPWDIEDYYLQHVKAGRDKKRVKFPNPLFGAFSEPLMVVDIKGRIVLWYLPELLSVPQQVSVFFSVVAN